MQLSFNGTEVIGRQLRINLTDEATGQPYPIRMNEDGSYLHRYQGNKPFMTALEIVEAKSVSGRTMREMWLKLLKEHLAKSSA
jgi:hypothetical protein